MFFAPLRAPPPAPPPRSHALPRNPSTTLNAEGKTPTVSFEGQYREGRKDGIGKLLLPNGDKYHGAFAGDKFEGEGTYFSANGDIYSGSWKAGVKSGEGTLMYAKDESQLVGTWAKGAMVTGKWIWKDGTSWHGPFKASQPLGRGVFYFPNGLMQEGEYVTVGEAEEGEEGELKTQWKAAGPARAGNAPAAELLRAN